MKAYDETTPWDVISWHWYEPCYGSFVGTITDNTSTAYGRTPAQCLADFKKPNGAPMDVWITEFNRSVKVSSTSYENGSFSTTSSTHQDWAAEAQVMQSTIADFQQASSVKAIFAYELLDEPILYGSSADSVDINGYMGLMTGLKGQYKNAFYTFQSAIAARP